jgi:hypothetical protein
MIVSVLNNLLKCQTLLNNFGKVTIMQLQRVTLT